MAAADQLGSEVIVNEPLPEVWLLAMWYSNPHSGADVPVPVA